MVAPRGVPASDVVHERGVDKPVHGWQGIQATPISNLDHSNSSSVALSLHTRSGRPVVAAATLHGARRSGVRGAATATTAAIVHLACTSGRGGRELQLRSADRLHISAPYRL
eukprot:scaffold2727_cov385-Prasinococcus_capsulatus_cf.AAC.11